nr:anaerobic C4-dicarboxylate transporter family protein [Veillonella denticariosi]
MGIGYAGGLGGVVLLSLGMGGMFPGQIPWDVILIIMSAIAAICALQLAGGLIIWCVLRKVFCVKIRSISTILLRP